MERLKPWLAVWVSALLGAVAGCALTLVAVRGDDALSTPAWQEAIAWQGWVGSIFGALVSAGVAFAVLFATLSHSRGQFEAEQRRAAAAEQDARRKQRTQSLLDRERFVAQMTAERDLAMEQLRLVAWGDLVAALREFIEFPTAERPLRELESRVVSAMIRWRLYTPASEEVVREGTRGVVNRVLGDAIGLAREERRTPDGARESAAGKRVRIEDSVERIVELQQMYETWHRGGASQDDAARWFEARAQR